MWHKWMAYYHVSSRCVRFEAIHFKSRSVGFDVNGLLSKACLSWRYNPLGSQPKGLYSAPLSCSCLLNLFPFPLLALRPPSYFFRFLPISLQLPANPSYISCCYHRRLILKLWPTVSEERCDGCPNNWSCPAWVVILARCRLCIFYCLCGF